MNEEFYIKLIYKELSDEIKASEQKELTSWRAASDENELTYRAVKQAWDASELLRADVEAVDVKQEFAALEALIEEEPKEEEAVLRSLPKRVAFSSSLKIAASILLLIVSSVLLYNNFIKTGDEVAQVLSVESGESARTVVLADGSTVHLNKNSYLLYPEYFDENERIVELKGEAFFEVTHNKEQPFKVKTQGEEIKVLGTSFNVKELTQQERSVYVSTGKVEVLQVASGEKVVLTKGEKVFSNSAEQTLLQTKSSDNDLAWHTKKLFFLNTPMKEVKAQLEAFYGVKIAFEHSNFENCTLDNYSLTEQTIESVLEDIGTILSFEVEKNSKNIYVIKGGECH